MDHRIVRVTTAGALLLGAAGCATTMGSPPAGDSPAVAIAAPPPRPPADTDAEPRVSRPLGTFATLDQAVAAAKAAQPDPGTFASATVDGRDYLIDAAGNAATLAHQAGSGAVQRPPQTPKGQ